MTFHPLNGLRQRVPRTLLIIIKQIAVIPIDSTEIQQQNWFIYYTFLIDDDDDGKPPASTFIFQQ